MEILALLRPLAALLCIGALAGVAHAQTAAPAPPSLAPALEQEVRQLALDATRQISASTSGASGIQRVEIVVGQLDPRLRLAPCERVQPYLPPGGRLWGKSRIGLRCVQGPTPWNVYLPISVKIYGTALVAAVPLSAGSTVGANDLTQAEVDLAEDNSAAVSDAGAAVGRILLRALNVGDGLRQAHLKQRQWFAAGDVVKLRAVGAGFVIAGEGQALTPGLEGQSARVRTESGRIVSGLPVGERTVELAL